MKYDVKIMATVIKTITVEDADSEEDAIAAAHEMFSTECEGLDEEYNEETLSVKAVE